MRWAYVRRRRSREHVGQKAGDQAVEEHSLGEGESQPLDTGDLVAHLGLAGDGLDHLAEDDADADAGTDRAETTAYRDPEPGRDPGGRGDGKVQKKHRGAPCRVSGE